MEWVEKIDKKGIYEAEREIKGIENRIIEGLRRREERKRLREGIGKEIRKEGYYKGKKTNREGIRTIEKERELKGLDISKV